MTVSIWSLIATPFVMYAIVSLIEWQEKRSLERWRKLVCQMDTETRARLKAEREAAK